MRFISLFAGIGGFDLALTRLGHTCVYANEWDKYASQIYNKNFGENVEGSQVRVFCNTPRHQPDSDSISLLQKQPKQPPVDTRDIRTVTTYDIPDHDLLCGGFPCQAFSVAGKRGGFDDTRGTLFYEIARIAGDKRPRLLLLENVKGLLSHDNGLTFKTIIATFAELGYDLQWQVLNSKNFGVPQNRERVFIVGHLRGTPRPQVFPITETNRTDQEVELRYEASRQISPTVRTATGGYHTPTITDGVEIRRLTPVECERLQGFPDGWTESISDTQRYKCLGNAVTVNVIQAIAQRL